MVRVRGPALDLWVVPLPTAPVKWFPPSDLSTLNAFGAGVHTYEATSFRALINF